MKMQGRNSHSCQLGMAVPDIPRGHLKGEPSTVWQIKERLSGKSESKPGATARSKCLRALNHALCGRQHSHRFLSSDTELYCWLKARLPCCPGASYLVGTKSQRWSLWALGHPCRWGDCSMVRGSRESFDSVSTQGKPRLKGISKKSLQNTLIRKTWKWVQVQDKAQH